MHPSCLRFLALLFAIVTLIGTTSATSQSSSTFPFTAVHQNAQKCRATFNRQNHLKCGRVLKTKINVPLARGNVDFSVQLKATKFRYVLSSTVLNITKVSFSFGTQFSNAPLVFDVLKKPRTSVKSLSTVSLLDMNVPFKNRAKPLNKRCCGKDIIFIRVRFAFCSRFGCNQNGLTKSYKGKIRCGKICQKNTGTPVFMSKRQDCSRCKKKKSSNYDQ